MLDIPQPIQSALGIQTNDILTPSYNSGPYIVYQIHGPFTHFECTNSIVILDHPEISLTLLSRGTSKKRASGYINNIRQVGDCWLTAQNDELFITRAEPAYGEPVTLFDIFDPPNKVEILPIQSPYQLEPLVDYESGPRHT